VQTGDNLADSPTRINIHRPYNLHSKWIKELAKISPEVGTFLKLSLIDEKKFKWKDAGIFLTAAHDCHEFKYLRPYLNSPRHDLFFLYLFKIII
jgi:hypothetical protein